MNFFNIASPLVWIKNDQMYFIFHPYLICNLILTSVSIFLKVSIRERRARSWPERDHRKRVQQRTTQYVNKRTLGCIRAETQSYWTNQLCYQEVQNDIIYISGYFKKIIYLQSILL